VRHEGIVVRYEGITLLSAQFQHEVDKVVVLEAVVILDNVLMGAILMDLDLSEELFR